jgi:hypothetical protein
MKIYIQITIEYCLNTAVLAAEFSRFSAVLCCNVV